MTRPVRLPDWQSQLTAFIATNSASSAEITKPTCALFVAGAVEAMTGVDLLAQFNDDSTTIKAGLKALRAAGFEDHVAFVAGHFAEINPANARPGDIAVMDGADGLPALGLVQGEYIYAVHPSGRIGLVPRATAKRVFHV